MGVPNGGWDVGWVSLDGCLGGCPWGWVSLGDGGMGSLGIGVPLGMLGMMGMGVQGRWVSRTVRDGCPREMGCPELSGMGVQGRWVSRTERPKRNAGMGVPNRTRWRFTEAFFVRESGTVAPLTRFACTGRGVEDAFGRVRARAIGTGAGSAEAAGRDAGRAECRAAGRHRQGAADSAHGGRAARLAPGPHGCHFRRGDVAHVGGADPARSISPTPRTCRTRWTCTASCRSRPSSWSGSSTTPS